MEKRWVGRHVDLALLSVAINDFFKRKGYVTKLENGRDNRYKLTATTLEIRDMQTKVMVNIRGHSGDFVVGFSSGNNEKTSLLGSLLSMFGGGALLLRTLKRKEKLEKLERDFWAYIESSLARMQSGEG